MFTARTATRAAARSARTPLRATRQVRFQTTNQQAAKAGGASGLVGGLAGGSLVFLAGYGYYHFSGVKSIVNAASTSKAQLQKLTQGIQDSAPEPNEALKWLRSTTSQYAAFIPGAKPYVDSAFNDLDKVQAKHGEEVDKIVNNAYKELKAATKSGLSMETAVKAWSVLEKAMSQLGELAKDSAGEIIDEHPELKEKLGGGLDQLKGMADSYGPEAKKELDQTYQQIKDVVKGGVSVETVSKIKKLIEEKTEKVRKLGDEAWKKGLEQAKPYLDKSPEVKKLIEENADALKQGNIGEIFAKVKDAVSSGNIDSLQDYVKQAGEKTKQSGFGKNIEQYAKMIPGADQILPKLMKLQEVAKTRGDDAEKILKEAFKDVQDVLTKKTDELEKLADSAKKEVKK
ncbi:hypothetical protein ONS95_014741 [Cadophora gregata]|uniref:uncharacterized protein n=1 Tax=Cadophora gregata TaxID=51156 RepID=UPI0026DAF918|nr:uncharacterized protein ONS95_014741 [Cadophora gregata]KAK0113032.1 hypothetical protein ONS95_014741 [Cadophora gregata]KAK0125153.1 hypothetical protein ONS96_009016 [Cadophora gregata f. sp. sojae]